jgi:hypothetical protein
MVHPDGDDSIRLPHAEDGLIEWLQVEPVYGLSDGNKIDAVGLQAYIFSAFNPVIDPLMGYSLGDLIGATIGGDDPLEMAGQLLGCLPIPGATIPG